MLDKKIIQFIREKEIELRVYKQTEVQEKVGNIKEKINIKNTEDPDVRKFVEWYLDKKIDWVTFNFDNVLLENISENSISFFIEKRNAKAIKTTLANYKSDFKKFMEWYENKTVNWEQLTEESFNNFKEFLLKKGQKPTTVNRLITLFRGFYNWLDIGKNPCKNITRVYTVYISDCVLSDDEVEKFLEIVKKGNISSVSGKIYQSNTKKRDHAVAYIILNAGLKINEICDLREENLERNSDWALNVKGIYKQRKVHLNDSARNALQEFIEEKEEYIVWAGSGYLFPTIHGKKISPRSIQDIFQRYGKIAGLKVTPQRLLQVFRKKLKDTGASTNVIAYLVGHKNAIDVSYKEVKDCIEKI